MTKPTRRQQHARLLRNAHRNGVYAELEIAQEGRCGICGRTAKQIAEQTGKPVRRLDIDHDHATMVIRGLLCRGCNMRLRKGMYPEWLRAAADYLEEAA